MTIWGILGGLIVLILVLGICAGIIILQVYLSKKDSRWLGLILPILSFCIAFFFIVAFSAFSVVQVTVHDAVMITADDALQYTMDDFRGARPEGVDDAMIAERLEEMEAIIMERTARMETMAYESAQQAPNIARIVLIFLLLNIPTAVFLAIYMACRGKRGKQRALEKMSVQDLG